MNNFVNKHIKWVFSLPALIFMMAMIAVPIAMTFLFSLNDWNLLMGNGMRFNWEGISGCAGQQGILAVLRNHILLYGNRHGGGNAFGPCHRPCAE